MRDKLLHDDFICVAHANETHHQDYLAPYMMRGHEKKIILIGQTPKNTLNFFYKYPNSTIRFMPTHPHFDVTFLQDPEICSKKMILLSNHQTELKKFHLDERFYQVHIRHGVLQKHANTGVMSWFSVFDTSIIHSHKDLKQIAKYHKIDIPINEDKKVFIIENIGNKDTHLIIGGNIRMKDYMANKLDKNTLLKKFTEIDHEKKTILYTPTFDSLQWTNGKDLCTLETFIDTILPKIKNLDEYNIIIKCHPNIQKNDFWTQHLAELNEKHPNIIINYNGFLLYYMQLADLLITDYSSATYDFLYFDKPILFIDNFNELSGKAPDIEDINHLCWLYAIGRIIDKTNVNNISEIIQSELKNDDFKEQRQRYKNMSFDDTLDGTQILNLCRQHPKYDR